MGGHGAGAPLEGSPEGLGGSGSVREGLSEAATGPADPGLELLSIETPAQLRHQVEVALRKL